MKTSQKELYKLVFKVIAVIGSVLILAALNDQTFNNLGLGF